MDDRDMNEELEALDCYEEHRVFESDYYNESHPLELEDNMTESYNREYFEFKSNLGDSFD